MHSVKTNYHLSTFPIFTPKLHLRADLWIDCHQLFLLRTEWIIQNSNIPSQQHLNPSYGWHEGFTGAGAKNNITWLMQAVEFMRRRPTLGAAMMKWKFVTGLPERPRAMKRPRVQETVHAYVCTALQQWCIHAKQANPLRCGERNCTSLWKSGEAEDFMLGWLLCGLINGKQYKNMCNICSVVYSANTVRWRKINYI